MFLRLRVSGVGGRGAVIIGFVGAVSDWDCDRRFAMVKGIIGWVFLILIGPRSSFEWHCCKLSAAMDSRIGRCVVCEEAL